MNNWREFVKDKRILKILLLGLLLRILVIPFLFHPDIKTYYFQTSFLQKGVLNIYEYLDINKESLPLKEEFVYQPLSYLTLGVYQIVAKPLLGSGFDNWLWDASQQSVERIGLFRYLFILKFPYLITDILVGFLIAGFFKSRKMKRRMLSLWLLNPITIFIIYAYGNLDIIPVLLVLVSLYLAKKEKLVGSSVLLGLAAGFKAYPMLFLPLLAFRSKTVKQFIAVILSGVGIFTLIALPFLSESFKNAALVSGLTTRIFLPSIDIGFGVKISVPVLLISLLYLISLGKKVDINYLFLGVLLLLISFIHFHIQWLLWVLPLLVILFGKRKDLRILIIIFAITAFILPLFYDDKSMTVSLFSGLSYYFTLLPTPFGAVRKIFDPYQFQSLLQSILAASSLLIVWKILNYQKS